MDTYIMVRLPDSFRVKKLLNLIKAVIESNKHHYTQTMGKMGKETIHTFEVSE